MTAPIRLVPTGSQTVGPFFRIGLEYLIAEAAAVDLSSAITVHGKVIDRDGAPVPDAMLEFWSPDVSSTPNGFPQGFRRVATGLDGTFSLTMPRPSQNRPEQAPHLLVLIFARGLMRHLISRLYFEDEVSNVADAVLMTVPAERRNTLIARTDGAGSFRWDVILQGAVETVFFAW